MSDYGAPLVRGLLFGMALQLAVGPVCIFVFLAGAAQGFYEAMSGVLGAALVDALEIALAITGVGLIVRRGGAAGAKLRIFGALVLLLFGASFILDAVGFSILPDFALFSAASADGTFIKALLLTLSNPLTLVFWVGVFSVKVSREGYGGASRCLFGLGCVLATLLFLSLAALAGGLAKEMITPCQLRLLNAAAGLLMFYFAYRSFRGGEGG